MDEVQLPFIPEEFGKNRHREHEFWVLKFFPCIPMEIWTSSFWRRALAGVCSDTDDMISFDPILTVQKLLMLILSFLIMLKTPSQIWFISTMLENLTFHNFSIPGLFDVYLGIMKVVYPWNMFAIFGKNRFRRTEVMRIRISPKC